MSDHHPTEGKYADYTMRAALEDIDRRLIEIEETHKRIEAMLNRPQCVPQMSAPHYGVSLAEAMASYQGMAEHLARLTQR